MNKRIPDDSWIPPALRLPDVATLEALSRGEPAGQLLLPIGAALVAVPDDRLSRMKRLGFQIDQEQ